MMNLFCRSKILPLSLLVAATVILLFPDLVYYPQGTTNLDPSWVWSLGYASAHHLQWGIDYVFTYGPLGFLNSTCAYGSYGRWGASALFSLFCPFIMLLVLVQGCLKSGDCTWSATFICELIFCLLVAKACGFEPQTAIFLTAYGMLILSLVQGSSLRGSLFIAFLLALSSQIKGTAFIGASALIVTNLAACFVLRDCQKITHGVVLAAAYPLLSVLLWVASGQALFHFPAYFRGTYEIVSGYGKVMAVEGYTFQVVSALFFIGLYLVAFGLGWRQNRAQLALFLVTGPVIFLNWKEGFVRQDPILWGGHSESFFGVMTYIFWIHYLAVKVRAPLSGDLFLGGAICCLGYFAMCIPGVIPAWNPSLAISHAQSALQTAFFDDHEVVQEQVGADLRHGYNFPPVITSALQTVPTLILPCDLILAPAYHLPLALPPIPQIYSSYTPYLDYLQTAWLNKNRPPQVLYAYDSLDNHYPLFESPDFSYHLLRQYSVVANTDTCAVLLRNQVGDPQIRWQVTTQSGGFDQEILLPPTDSKVHLLMRVDIKRSLLGEIYGFFYKTTIPKILFHLKDGTTRSFVFVYPTGKDGLLVSHFIDNLDQYIRLSKVTWSPNVRSISFSVDKNRAWQFADSFPIEFGTSTVSDSPALLRTSPLPLTIEDGSWSFHSGAAGEVLSSSQDGVSIPVGPSSSEGGHVDSLKLELDKGEIRLIGWAGAAATGETCKSVLLVSGSKILKLAPVDQPRPDVVTAFQFPQLYISGFDVSVPISLFSGLNVPVRVFGFIRGATSAQDRLLELKYNAQGSASDIAEGYGYPVLTSQGLIFR